MLNVEMLDYYGNIKKLSKIITEIRESLSNYKNKFNSINIEYEIL